MGYNGREVMKGVAYDAGWTTQRNLLGHSPEQGQFDMHTLAGHKVVIGWREDNSAFYVQIDADEVRGPLALIKARRFIEGKDN